MRPILYTATAADVTAGFTPPLIMDIYHHVANYGLQYFASGGGAGTGDFQRTYDDPFNPPAGGLTWESVQLDATGRGTDSAPARAYRVNTPVLADAITIVAQGLL